DLDLTWKFLPRPATAVGIHPRRLVHAFQAQAKAWRPHPQPEPGPDDARVTIQEAALRSGDPGLADFASHLGASAEEEPQGDREAIVSFIGDPLFATFAHLAAEAPATYANYERAVRDMNQTLNVAYNLSPGILACPGTPKVRAPLIDPGGLFTAPFAHASSTT